MNFPQLPERVKPDWRDPSTISAAEGWLRLAVGLAFSIILLVMLASGRIDPSGFIKALLGVLAIDRGANGALAMMRARNQRKIEGGERLADEISGTLFDDWLKRK